jgi:hypothetical protein
MLFIAPENKYPRYIGDLQLENPSWKNGDKLPDGWIEVIPEQAIPENAINIREAFPEFRNDKYYQKFEFDFFEPSELTESGEIGVPEEELDTPSEITE